jgi:hypothetical protein
MQEPVAIAPPRIIVPSNMDRSFGINAKGDMRPECPPAPLDTAISLFLTKET